MTFWDSSALVPLFVGESATQEMRALATGDPEMLVWWGSYVECASALARREREGFLDARSHSAALGRLKALSDSWYEVEATEIVRETAARFLRVHALRAADALQLAAAFVGANSQPQALALVTLDERLADAARKEGFQVQPSI